MKIEETKKEFEELLIQMSKDMPMSLHDEETFGRLWQFIESTISQTRQEVIEEIKDKVIGLTKEKHDDVWVISYDQVIELLDNLHSQTKEK